MMCRLKIKNNKQLRDKTFFCKLSCLESSRGLYIKVYTLRPLFVTQSQLELKSGKSDKHIMQREHNLTILCGKTLIIPSPETFNTSLAALIL